MKYLKQKAAPWVTISVLAGGMVSAIMLFFLAKVENDIQSVQDAKAELYSNLN